MEMSLVATLFPGIASLFVQDPVIACARIFMIIFGFILAYLGFKRTLEPLIMVPMGVGMICINCGVTFLDGGKLGTFVFGSARFRTGCIDEYHADQFFAADL